MKDKTKTQSETKTEAKTKTETKCTARGNEPSEVSGTEDTGNNNHTFLNGKRRANEREKSTNAHTTI